MHDFEAHTYDFTVSNNTKDEVSDFLFKLTFDRDVFLFSAWNGALEIHQHTDSGELVDLVPDLRVFKPENHTLKTFTVDGESMIWMHAGDYLVYHPSSSMNAMEMPIEPFEGTTPGIILYVSIGENLDGSVVELEYTYHRQLTDEPMFLISLLGMLIWLIALVIFAITSAQIKNIRNVTSGTTRSSRSPSRHSPASSTRRIHTQTATPSASPPIPDSLRRNSGTRARSLTAFTTSPFSTTAGRSACPTTSSASPES